jgi:hypothetical protein
MASFKKLQTRGRKLPMIKPASRAMMKPDSLVRFSDQPILSACLLSGVAAI